MKNNLIKEATWYNPYIAIDTKGHAYKLDNIIIYSDYGVLVETDRGWFGNSNDLGDQYVGDINKRMKIDFSKKENFIIKSQKKNYKLETNHTLKDWREMMDPSADCVDPYYIINTIKQTYNADIDEMEALK